MIYCANFEGKLFFDPEYTGPVAARDFSFYAHISSELKEPLKLL